MSSGLFELSRFPTFRRNPKKQPPFNLAPEACGALMLQSETRQLAKGRQSVKTKNLATMTTDELWAWHEEIRAALSTKLQAEKRQVQERLDELGPRLAPPADEARERRPYPKVLPKFQNPGQPTQTWAGRGKQPRWVSEMLEAGRSIDDLRMIPETA
jgi:DNA-binding protein H-NS